MIISFPDIYTEKTVEVPLHGVNFPADKALRTFPSKVQITFQVGLKRFRSIKASDFIINISYEELLKLGSDKYTVDLGLNVDWYASKRVTVFAEGHNLCNRRIYDWSTFPQYSAGFTAGVKLSF